MPVQSPEKVPLLEARVCRPVMTLPARVPLNVQLDTVPLLPNRNETTLVGVTEAD